MNETIALLIIGLLGGIIAGSMGVGGGIIIVPALVFFLSLNQHQAQGTSLAVLLFPVGAFGVWNYYKEGYINFKYVFIIAAAFIAGSYLGSLISVNLPEKTLKITFGLLMLFAGFKMIFAK